MTYPTSRGGWPHEPPAWSCGPDCYHTCLPHGPDGREWDELDRVWQEWYVVRARVTPPTDVVDRERGDR